MSTDNDVIITSLIQSYEVVWFIDEKDGKSPLLVLNSKRPALTYELEQKHDAKWIARVTIGQEQFTGEGYKKNIAKGDVIFLIYRIITSFSDFLDIKSISELIYDITFQIS